MCANVYEIECGIVYEMVMRVKCHVSRVVNAGDQKGINSLPTPSSFRASRTSMRSASPTETSSQPTFCSRAPVLTAEVSRLVSPTLDSLRSMGGVSHTAGGGLLILSVNMKAVCCPRSCSMILTSNCCQPLPTAANHQAMASAPWHTLPPRRYKDRPHLRQMFGVSESSFSK